MTQPSRSPGVFSRLTRGPRTRREALTPSPVFVLAVVVTVVGAVLATTASTPRLAGVGVFVFVLAGWVVTLSLHEFAHAVVAYHAGDRDVLSAGYLTLNPLLYGHPVLSVVLPVLFVAVGGIGLPGGAVYLHRHRFRTRGLASAVSLAGPAVNLVIGVVLLVAVAGRPGPGAETLGGLALWSGIGFLGFLQITAALLNLLPIPGLDGWGAIDPWVKPETSAAAARLAPFGLIAVFGLLFVPQINRVFFDVVYALCGLTGADTIWAQIGRQLFRFWTLQG